MPMAGRFPEAQALRIILSDRRYLAAYMIGAPLLGLLYALFIEGLLLGTFALWVLRYLDPAGLFVSIGMGMLVPLILLINVYVWRNPSCCAVGAGGRGEGSAVGSLLLALIPNALCCTPIIPAVLALFLAGAPLLSVSVPIQYYLNAYRPLFYGLALLAMWWGLRVAGRSVASPERKPTPVAESAEEDLSSQSEGTETE